jgi:predicted deacylase
MNPDGVDNGHWRHNAAGIDLNRDWLYFNQPETRLVSDLFRKLKEQPGARVYFGIDFHSTQEDVFYTLSRDLGTDPPGFTDAWLDAIRRALPDYYVNDEPSGLGSPVSKNWFYQTFGVPATTYEVGDEVDRDQIRRVAVAAAEATMRLLLEEGE